ncbi:hypothetical protein Ssi03_53000 [Sphaerisporangium siamense]|uniref:PH domain-containing protein n=1 Tax=Sphaerisporangium siamense TaxID=795645 RepID=A0A7W7D6X0_9ACTN|nr:hypothetical protein [Sphaerisporangium siamense]MBB4701322.1 hypothetical protein [Sphaerisporangium siamense]GII87310.1 hypothetical protein Ssi03_53000 [Sphaerisporangium siamense]
MLNPPIRLSVNASTGQKVTVSIIGLLFLGVLAGIAGVAALALGRSDPEFRALPAFESGAGAFPALAVRAVFAVAALLMIGFLVTMVLGTYRRQAILSGTVLEVRGLLGTRRADLATSRVWIDSEPEYVRNPHGEGTIPTGRRVPHLMAEDPATGRKVRLRLHSMARTLLPPHELNALADAVGSGTRPEPDAAQATRTATLLRRLADDPIARLL